MGQIGPKLSFCLKRGFFGKIDKCYDCTPLCYKVSKMSLAYGRSWGTRCYSFGPNWTQITDLHLKRGFFFWKNILMLILTTSCTLSKYYNIQKKLINVDHKIQGCIIFGQIGLGYFSGWGKGDWLSLLLSICCTSSYWKV